MTKTTRFVVTALVALAAGCDFGVPVTSAPPGTIAGRLTYAGAAAAGATLVIEAFGTMPPVGEPLARATIDGAQFPQDYLLEGVRAGTVYLVARLVDASGATPALGTYPSVLAVSPIVLEADAGRT